MAEGQALLRPRAAESAEPKSRPPTARYLPVIASLGLAAACVAALARHQSRRKLTASGGPLTVSRLSLNTGITVLEENPCEVYPYLKFAVPAAVVYNNLANKGPDQGRGEGIVFKTIDLGKGAGDEFDKEVYVTINGTSDHYKPFSSRLNGMQGKYGTVNLMPDSHIDLKFTFIDRDTMKKLTMKEFAITFFDLDTGSGGQSGEYIKIGGFKSFHLTDTTEVKVSDEPDGRKMFSGTTVGTGEDNPVDPMFLTQQQKDRAVTILFGPTHTLEVTLGAKPGTGPRFFTFVGRPSLLCAVTVQQNFAPPLEDLTFTPPMEGAVMTGEQEKFVSFSVHKGQKVKEGDLVATTLRNGKTHEYHAPFSGQVTQIQDKLKPNEELDMRLSEKILAVVKRPSIEPLPEAPGVVAGGPGKEADLPDDARFVKYLVSKGDKVQKGDPIAVVKREGQNGPDSNVVATDWGQVQARQDDLERGMPVRTVQDKNLITLRPFDALGPISDDTQKAAVVPEGRDMRFEEYKVQKGDVTKVGDPIAVVTDSDGKKQTIKASHSGVVSGLHKLSKGAPIDRVADRNLCVTGKFPPLPVDPGQAAINIADSLEGEDDDEDNETSEVIKPGELSFVAYEVKENDIVETGQKIAVVEDETGKRHSLVAPRPGVVVHLQDGLKKGMVLGKVMQDENMATLDRLPQLDVDESSKGSFAPKDEQWRFKEWKKKVGENVEKDDAIAILEQQGGAERNVAAGRSGTIEEEEGHLSRGDIVEQVTKDDDLATVGKFKEPEVGFREMGVKVPDMNATFKEWKVKDGQKVHCGDTIATVELFEPTLPVEEESHNNSAETHNESVKTGNESKKSRRLSMSTIEVPSPANGWVSFRQELKPGQSIDKQAAGPTIAKIDLGWPWWLTLGIALLVLSCCLCCLNSVMQKNLKPDYKQLPSSPEPEPYQTHPEKEADYRPMPMSSPPAQAETGSSRNLMRMLEQPGPTAAPVAETAYIDERPAEPPRPVEEPKPEGLRLDFADTSGRINTVYATRRPLGILHNYEAPIVAHDFTPNSYAKQQLGVRQDWKLTRIGDEELNNSTNFEYVNETLAHGLRNWAIWPLPLEFCRELGGRGMPIVREFVERPLGMEFTNIAPIRVDRIYKDSPAEKQGVEVGWYLTKIGDFDVHENHNFREVLKHFKEGVQGLDDPGRQYLQHAGSC